MNCIKNFDLSIVIPVYNSTSSVIELCDLIVRTCNAETEIGLFEIILIDDGSINDKTWPILSNLAKNNPGIIKAFKLSKNFGKASAVLCGFSLSLGEYIIMMDDDLQHDPRYIVDFYTKRNHDIVIANFEKKNHSFIKKITSNLKGYFDYKLTGKPKHIKNSSYKLINKNIIDRINKMRISQPFISGLLFSLTNDVININIKHNPRKYGSSQFTIKKMMHQFSNLIFNNSSLLLRLVSYLGMVISLISFLLATYFAYRYFRLGIQVQGWTSIMVITLFTSGTILFSLGIFGNYFIRLLHISEKRPSYVIQKTSK